MLPTPLFSVLIANYNNGIYLEEALQSVLAQTYTNWEIILVDDASTDNSKEIYKKYSSDTRIHIYYNDKNYGCGYTKRRCVELAKGEICGFLDPDDALVTTAIEELSKVLINNQPDVSFVYSDMFIVNKNMEIMNMSSYQKEIQDGHSYLQSTPGSISHFEAFTKKAYNKTSGIDPTIKQAVDTDLYLKLEEVGKFIFVKKKLYYYRIGTGNNISSDYGKGFSWNFIVMYEACKRRNLDFMPILVPYYNFNLDMNLKHRNNTIQKELWATYNSFSFKLGKFLTAPFRWIKKITSDK
ncbi:MAG: glycosyltransferase [Bacteroidales bacterium]|nr:glycosyltransferase [Bacteroidales bacterium]